MRLLLVLCLLLSWGSFTAFAQAIENGQAVPSPISTTVDQVWQGGDALFVVDAVTQRETSRLGTDPLLNQFDGGISGNAAQISQLGDRNVTILQQYGDQNAASIQLAGNGNLADATQDGLGNALGLSVLGDDNVVTASQLNGNNALSLTLEGRGNDIPVRQDNQFGRGNDLTLTLIGLEEVRLPFPITQVGVLGQPIEITVRRAGN